jgi:RecA-family ATPase
LAGAALHVERHGIRLVVFDNATDAMAGDLNGLHQVAAFVNLLTGLALRMDGAVIILHHPNKAGSDWLGSMAWHNKVRSRLLIEDAGIEGDTDARIIRNPKLNYGPQGGQIASAGTTGPSSRRATYPTITTRSWSRRPGQPATTKCSSMASAC